MYIIIIYKSLIHYFILAKDELEFFLLPMKEKEINAQSRQEKTA